MKKLYYYEMMNPTLLMSKGDKFLKIGFCNKEKVSGYDIYLGKEGSLEEVFKYIK